MDCEEVAHEVSRLFNEDGELEATSLRGCRIVCVVTERNGSSAIFEIGKRDDLVRAYFEGRQGSERIARAASLLDEGAARSWAKATEFVNGLTDTTSVCRLFPDGRHWYLARIHRDQVHTVSQGTRGGEQWICGRVGLGERLCANLRLPWPMVEPRPEEASSSGIGFEVREPERRAKGSELARLKARRDVKLRALLEACGHELGSEGALNPVQRLVEDAQARPHCSREEGPARVATALGKLLASAGQVGTEAEAYVEAQLRLDMHSYRPQVKGGSALPHEKARLEGLLVPLRDGQTRVPFEI